MNLYDHVKRLHDSELYKDLKQLTNLLETLFGGEGACTSCSSRKYTKPKTFGPCRRACLVLTLSDHSAELLTLIQKYQCIVYYGNALYQLQEYRKAENIYRKALLLKKAINKTKGKSGAHVEVTSEVEVKYKIHLCHCHLKQYREAINVLESVFAKKRSSKINLALAQLYQRAGMDRPAMTCYKEVIRECPLALEAVMGLISLGVKGAEVIVLVMNSLPHGSSSMYDWLTSWIKAHSFMAVQDYSYAVTTFRHLDCKPHLKNNVRLLSSLGEALFLNGEYKQALLILQWAHSMDRLYLENTDILAYLLIKEKKMGELENLANQLMEVNEHAPEPWIAIGYYCLASKKATRAVYFAQKAYTIDSRNAEALLLKGMALLELKKMQDAASHFREAVTLAPHRFEGHKGLIDCYIANHRPREAINLAGKAVRILGSNARSLTLYASVLVKEPTMASKARPCVEKAMKLDPSNLEAVYVMTEILGQEQQYDKAIELLRRTLVNHNACHLHKILGDLLSQTNDALEAVHHYSIALRMDPANLSAKEGIQRIEKQSENGLEGAYDVEPEEMEGSDNDADLEGSDVESTWSDTDFS